MSKCLSIDIEHTIVEHGESRALLQAMALVRNILFDGEHLTQARRMAGFAAFSRAIDLATLVDDVFAIRRLIQMLEQYERANPEGYGRHLLAELAAAIIRTSVRPTKAELRQAVTLHKESAELWRASNVVRLISDVFPVASRSGLSANFNYVTTRMEAGLEVRLDTYDYERMDEETAKTEARPGIRAILNLRQGQFPNPFKARQIGDIHLDRTARENNLTGGEPENAILVVTEPLLLHCDRSYLTLFEIREQLVVMAEALLCIRARSDPRLKRNDHVFADSSAGDLAGRENGRSDRIRYLSAQALTATPASIDGLYSSLAAEINAIGEVIDKPGRRPYRMKRLHKLEKIAGFRGPR